MKKLLFTFSYFMIQIHVLLGVKEINVRKYYYIAIIVADIFLYIKLLNIIYHTINYIL